MDTLKNLHPHQRDSRIVFDEGPHIYYIDGSCEGYISCTTWNHSHFEHFDADAIIDKMMSSKNWPNNKYYGKTSDEIKQLWEQNRDQAAEAGTKMHLDIEYFYNQMEVKNNSIEYQYFQQFVKDYPMLKAYRTEWTVFHEELKIAGSIDMIFENPDGTLQIYDWKRCKEIAKAPAFNKYSHIACIDHLPDTNYWHYCLQLNTYKAIIEEKYGKQVTDMYLVCMHPDNKNKSYQRIKVADLQNEVKDLFKKRLKDIK
jgi:hypothetical protein